MPSLNIIDDYLHRFEIIGERRAQLLSFLIKLNLFAIPLYAILILDLSFAPMQKLIADATFSLLSAAGFSPSINGLLISIPIKNGNWGAFINWDCTAWKSMLAFFALVMATKGRQTDVQSTPSWFKGKAAGLMMFLPLIFAANLLRIFFIFYYVRTFDLAYYQIVHDVVWSWGMIFAVLAFWLVWMKKINFNRTIR